MTSSDDSLGGRRRKSAKPMPSDIDVPRAEKPDDVSLDRQWQGFEVDVLAKEGSQVRALTTYFGKEQKLQRDLAAWMQDLANADRLLTIRAVSKAGWLLFIECPIGYMGAKSLKTALGKLPDHVSLILNEKGELLPPAPNLSAGQMHLSWIARPATEVVELTPRPQSGDTGATESEGEVAELERDKRNSKGVRSPKETTPTTLETAPQTIEQFRQGVDDQLGAMLHNCLPHRGPTQHHQLQRIIENAQTTPPKDKVVFVATVNLLLDALQAVIALDDGRFARLCLKPAGSQDGSIQFKVPGDSIGGFSADSRSGMRVIRVVPQPTA